MLVHIFAVTSLTACSIMKVYNVMFDTAYLFYSSMYVTMDFLSCLSLAWIMFKVSGQKFDDLTINRGSKSLNINHKSGDLRHTNRK